MLLERLAEYITESVIIGEAADFGHHSESLKGFIVQFVDEGQVRVGDDHVGKLLYISETMRKAIWDALAFGLRLLAGSDAGNSLVG